MKSTFLMIGMIGASLAVNAFAETVTLTGVNGVSTTVNGQGVYVSPYEISIDGAASIEAWCVDFTDHVSIGESWGADLFVGAGAYFSASDYPELEGIIQAEINDPNPDLVAYQMALWGVTDPTDFAAPTGQYLADESTPLTGSFFVVDGSGCNQPAQGCPQEFIAHEQTLRLSDSPEPSGLILAIIGGALLAAYRLFPARRRS